MQLYVSSQSNDNKRKKPVRDIYAKKIQEQENLGRHLREKQKVVQDSHDANMRQLEMWRDLTLLMKCKTAASNDPVSVFLFFFGFRLV